MQLRFGIGTLQRKTTELNTQIRFFFLTNNICSFLLIPFDINRTVELAS